MSEIPPTPPPAIINIQAAQEQTLAEETKRPDSIRSTSHYISGNVDELKRSNPKVYSTILRFFQLNIFNMIKRTQDQALERQKKRNRET